MDNYGCFVGKVNKIDYSNKKGGILNFTLKVQRRKKCEEYDLISFSAYLELANEFKDTLNIGDTIRVIGSYRAPIQEKQEKAITGCFAHFLVQQIVPIKSTKK